MEDMNKTQGLQGNNPDQPLNVPQSSQDNNPDQPLNVPQGSGPNTNEKTYWESQTPSPETPEQFYKYYEQQLNGGTPSQQNKPQPQNAPTGYTPPGYSQTGYSAAEMNPQPPKRKKRRKVFAFVIILFLILSAAAAAAYAYQDTLLNALALYTKSPADYYAYVEKKVIHESVDNLTPYLNFSTPEVAYDVSTDVTFNRETLNSLMQSSMGVSLADLESSIGLPIENIGLDVLFGYNNNLLNETLGLRLNHVELITLELLMDTAKQEMFMRLPGLSDAYLKQSIATGETASNNYTDQLGLMTPARNADMLYRYSNIIIDHVTQVTTDKNAVLTLDTLERNCTKLTVTITKEDMNNMTLAILDEASEDDYFLDMLPMFEMTKAEYQKSISDMKAEVNATDDTLSSESIQMLVYVDSFGNIIGREFGAKDSLASFGYTSLIKDSYQEFNVYLKDDAGNKVLNAGGNQTKDQKSYDGTITIDLSVPSSELLSNLSFDIQYEDVRSEKKDNRILNYGTYTLSSLDLMGLQIIMENSVVDDIQNNKTIVQMGAATLVTIDTKVDYLEDFEAVMPPTSAEIYDVTQAESYIASLNLEAYIADLSEQLGIDLQSILDLYLPGVVGE
ncbi:MAG: hypothetical protein ACYDEX_06830 [Mobilitalea sp.]